MLGVYQLVDGLMLSSTRFIVRWYNNCNKSTNIINERSSGSIKSDGIQAAFLNRRLTQKEQQRIEKALSNGEIGFFVCCTRTI